MREENQHGGSRGQQQRRRHSESQDRGRGQVETSKDRFPDYLCGLTTEGCPNLVICSRCNKEGACANSLYDATGVYLPFLWIVYLWARFPCDCKYFVSDDGVKDMSNTALITITVRRLRKCVQGKIWANIYMEVVC
jgi:hypothetical protein